MKSLKIIFLCSNITDLTEYIFTFFGQIFDAVLRNRKIKTISYHFFRNYLIMRNIIFTSNSKFNHYRKAQIVNNHYRKIRIIYGGTISKECASYLSEITYRNNQCDLWLQRI